MQNCQHHKPDSLHSQTQSPATTSQPYSPTTSSHTHQPQSANQTHHLQPTIPANYSQPFSPTGQLYSPTTAIHTNHPKASILTNHSKPASPTTAINTHQPQPARLNQPQPSILTNHSQPASTNHSHQYSSTTASQTQPPTAINTHQPQPARLNHPTATSHTNVQQSIHTNHVQPAILIHHSHTLLTNHGAVGGGHHLLGARGQLDASPPGVRVVADDDARVAAGAHQLATVTGLLLDAADDGTFRHGAQRQDVADLQSGWHTQASIMGKVVLNSCRTEGMNKNAADILKQITTRN